MGWEGIMPKPSTPFLLFAKKRKKCLKKAEKFLCNFSPAPINISQNLDENVKIIWCGLRSDFHCALNVQLMVMSTAKTCRSSAVRQRPGCT